MSDNNNKSDKGKLSLYVSLRVFVAIVITVAVLWGGTMIIKFFSAGPDKNSPYQDVVENNPALKKMDGLLDDVIVHKEEITKTASEVHDTDTPVADKKKDEAQSKSENDATHGAEKTADSHTAQAADGHGKKKGIKPIQDPDKDFGTKSVEKAEHIVRGSKFASAMVEQLDYELNERTLGWRPNDIFLFFTDNVANFQEGVLEVTRRTCEKLVERIARTSRAVTFDKNLHNSRSLFNHDAERYIFPDPVDSYNEGIAEVEKYRERLNKGKATFQARADNLVPLLEAYEDLLGDCDERLVKQKNRNGSRVSTFEADDHFYYSQGVAKSMLIILHAVIEDFGPVLESRGAAADLEHAMEELEHATHLHPFFIQEGDLDGFFANHRANLATYISHARSYIQYVIKTMTT